MERISFIMEALYIGKHSTNNKDSKNIEFAYMELKSLLQCKLATNPEAISILNEYEQEPGRWEILLQEEFMQTGVDQDDEIINVSWEILKQIKPDYSLNDKYNIKISDDIRELTTGDYEAVHMLFGNAPHPSESYSCPQGDYKWHRRTVGSPIPECPTHQVPLVRMKEDQKQKKRYSKSANKTNG